MKPHFITETKNGYQLIWLVKDIKTETEFIFIVKGLTQYFKADEGGLSINKVLRLPGFYHLKNPKDPFECILLKDYSGIIPKYSKSKIIKNFNLKNLKNMTNKITNTPSLEIQSALQLPMEKVLKFSANYVGIKIDLKKNSDGSLQIIENGEETSGFISSRGEFIHSSSGKQRKGNTITIAEYYLNEVGGNKYNRQEIAKILIGESDSAHDNTNIEGFPICEFSELLKMDLPKVEFVIEELIAKNSLNLIVGDPGSFKSWLYLYFVYCIINNKLVFNKYKVNPTNVLMINIDDHLSLTKDRMKKISFSANSDKKVFIWKKQEFKISGDKKQAVPDILSSIVKKKNIGLIIIDTLRQIHDNDENNSKEMNEVMTTLKQFAENNNCAFIIVHHKRKSGGKYFGGNIQTASGSIAIMANVFLSLHLNKYDIGKIKITREKGKSSKNIEPFFISFQDNKNKELLFELTDKPSLKISTEEIKKEIKEYYNETPEPELTKNDFIETFIKENENISKNATKNAFGELIKEKYIIPDGVKRTHNVIFYIKNQNDIP